MAVPFKKKIKVLLEKDCEFQTGVRKGRVLELRSEGYFVFWEEWEDPRTGECHQSTTSILGYHAVVTENNFGNLKILRRPLAKRRDPNSIRRCERLPVEVARQRFRKQFVLAIQSMLENGELKPTRDEFCTNLVSIVAKGNKKYDEYLAALSIQEAKRGGAKVRRRRNSEHAVDFHRGIKSGHTLWKWYWLWRSHGDDGLFDKFRNCGHHKRYSDEVDSLIERALNALWDSERPSIGSFVESVQGLFDAENDRRERLPEPAAKIKRPGYDYISGKVRELAPLDHALRKHSRDKAYKDLHTLGVGIETSRALERVEVDEYTVDLFVLMQDTGLFDHLPVPVKQAIGSDGSSCRVTLSGAIHVHTRCFVALQIVPHGVGSPLARTLEMIYMDKSPIADASGARFGWPMAGAPEAIVFDRGDKYITDDAYEILADLGITNLGAPAGKPWLKPYIERVFRSIHSDLLLRFSGRAFSNVVERGENDAAARASFTLEAFLGWLVRWVVDAYHTKPHSALGMSPAQAWEQARKECPPRSLTSAEMREAFGVTMRRKLTRKGVRVNHFDYQSDAVMRKFLREKVDDVEVIYWDGDIGAISLRSDNGPWLTVPAADEMWIGKTETDLRVWLAERANQKNGEGRIARRDFLIDANDASYRLKKLIGTISLPKTAEDLDRETERFMRHTDTAERRHAAGAYRDLLGDLGDDTEFPHEPIDMTDEFVPDTDLEDMDDDHSME